MDLTSPHSAPSEEEPAGAEQQAPSADRAPAEAAAPAAAQALPFTSAAATSAATLDRSNAARTSKEIGGKKFRVGAGDEYVPFRSRTRRRRRLIGAGVLAVLLLAAGGYGGVSLLSPPTQHQAATACSARGGVAAASHTIGARLPAAAQIKLNVYNSTNRQGLAASTAAQLKQRGFSVVNVTNDPLKADLTLPAQVRGGAKSGPAMRVVAVEVAGAQIKPDARADDSVDLVLGAGFTALASPDQVSAALKAATATAAKVSTSCAG